MRPPEAILTVIGCLAFAAVVADDLPFKPAKAQTEVAAQLQCKSLRSLLDAMVRSRIGVVATGVLQMERGGPTTDILLARAQEDGSWMLLSTNVQLDAACMLLQGPALSVAPTL
jgi:hypothetical protein